jgi:hypothetical protein
VEWHLAGRRADFEHCCKPQRDALRLQKLLTAQCVKVCRACCRNPLCLGEQEERVLPRVPFAACIEAWGAAEEMGDYHSAYLGRRTTARRASRLASFPPFLMVQLKRCARCGSAMRAVCWLLLLWSCSSGALWLCPARCSLASISFVQLSGARVCGCPALLALASRPAWAAFSCRPAVLCVRLANV